MKTIPKDLRALGGRKRDVSNEAWVGERAPLESEKWAEGDLGP